MGAPGFDDAPIVGVPLGDPHAVTMIYPYYENPDFLAFQLDQWAQYPEPVRQRLRAIIVDDGSQKAPAASVLSGRALPLPIELYRIEVDVRWNWIAARNIGAKHAPEGWLLLTDMDHVVDAKAAYTVTHGALNQNIIYRFGRREHTGEAIHPHPNSMLMTRETFWRIGGYDETLSGHYGTDGDWRRRCVAAARVRTLRTELVRYEYVGDSSTTHYKRKQPEDAAVKQIIKRRRPGWRPKALSFPYHQVVL